MSEIIINSKAQMVELVQDIACQIEEGELICLYGDLGAGKSFFAKHFINSLQEMPFEVLSPTFNLVYSYCSIKGEINHFDLYRLKSEEELENIGFFEVLRNSICLIEWPQIAEKYLNFVHKKIYIENIDIDNEESRKITVVNWLPKNA